MIVHCYWWPVGYRCIYFVRRYYYDRTRTQVVHQVTYLIVYRVIVDARCQSCIRLEYYFAIAVHAPCAVCSRCAAGQYRCRQSMAGRIAVVIAQCIHCRRCCTCRCGKVIVGYRRMLGQCICRRYDVCDDHACIAQYMDLVLICVTYSVRDHIRAYRVACDRVGAVARVYHCQVTAHCAVTYRRDRQRIAVRIAC